MVKQNANKKQSGVVVGVTNSTKKILHVGETFYMLLLSLNCL